MNSRNFKYFQFKLQKDEVFFQDNYKASRDLKKLYCKQPYFFQSITSPQVIKTDKGTSCYLIYRKIYTHYNT